MQGSAEYWQQQAAQYTTEAEHASAQRQLQLDTLLETVRVFQEATMIREARRTVTEHTLQELAKNAKAEVEACHQALAQSVNALEELLACITLLQTYGWKPDDHPRTVAAVKTASKVSKLIVQLLD
jgi:hypothetical protein